MNSTKIHILTSFLPLIFAILGFILFWFGKLFNKRGLIKVSLWTLLITGLVAMITSTFGGASMERAKADELVNLTMMRLHAWTAGLALISALALSLTSFLGMLYRRKVTQSSDQFLNISIKLVVVVVALLIITTALAIYIR